MVTSGSGEVVQTYIAQGWSVEMTRDQANQFLASLNKDQVISVSGISVDRQSDQFAHYMILIVYCVKTHHPNTTDYREGGC